MLRALVGPRHSTAFGSRSWRRSTGSPRFLRKWTPRCSAKSFWPRPHSLLDFWPLGPLPHRCAECEIRPTRDPPRQLEHLPSMTQTSTRDPLPPGISHARLCDPRVGQCPHLGLITSPRSLLRASLTRTCFLLSDSGRPLHPRPFRQLHASVFPETELDMSWFAITLVSLLFPRTAPRLI